MPPITMLIMAGWLVIPRPKEVMNAVMEISLPIGSNGCMAYDFV
jgi:hypothetical protein